MENEEPSPKKRATDVDYCLLTLKKERPLVYVSDIPRELPAVEVYTGHIRDVKKISRTVLLLNQKIPVKELQHLKRVRGDEILICPVDRVVGITIDDYLHQCSQDFENVFDNFEVRNVPKLAPKLKRQFETTKAIWPCNFHPDKYLEGLVDGSGVGDVVTHRRYMEVGFLVAKWAGVANVAIVVDPSINSVVAVGVDDRLRHPIQHAAMLVIDSVARTQDGGAWEHNLDWMTYLKENCPDVRLGHRVYRERNRQVSSLTDDNGPYLCTGCDVYVVRETCVMCSMALVHARVRRVFFSLPNEEDGALMSRVKLQTVTSLNHRFEVFTGFV